MGFQQDLGYMVISTLWQRKKKKEFIIGIIFYFLNIF